MEQSVLLYAWWSFVSCVCRLYSQAFTIPHIFMQCGAFVGRRPGFFISFFCVRLPSGAEYLLIARDEADLLAWVDAINKAIQNQTTVNPLSQPGHFCELTNLGGRRYLPYFSCSPIPVEPSDICKWAWSLIWDWHTPRLSPSPSLLSPSSTGWWEGTHGIRHSSAFIKCVLSFLYSC